MTDTPNVPISANEVVAANEADRSFEGMLSRVALPEKELRRLEDRSAKAKRLQEIMNENPTLRETIGLLHELDMIYFNI